VLKHQRSLRSLRQVLHRGDTLKVSPLHGTRFARCHPSSLNELKTKIFLFPHPLDTLTPALRSPSLASLVRAIAFGLLRSVLGPL